MSSCLILRGNDVLHLNSMFLLNKTRDRLYDRHLVIAHTLTPEGGALVNALTQGSTYIKLCSLCSIHDIPESSLRYLLAELARCGALHHKKIRPSQNMKQTVRIPSYAWRRDATLATIAFAIFRATWKLWVGVFLLGLGCVAGGILPFNSMLYLICWAVGLFMWSAVVHEWSHVALLNTQEIRSSVIQKGYRVGLLHQRASPGFDGLCALLGPVCGGTTALFLAYLSQSKAVLYIGLVLVLFHILSLFPNYGDGRSIIRTIHFYRRKFYDSSDS